MHEQHLERIGLIVLVGFVAAVAMHGWLLFYEGARYPESTYLCRPGDEFRVASGATRIHAFGDLLAPYLHAQGSDPYFTTITGSLDIPREFPSNYPPLVSVLMRPFTRLPYPWVVWSYLAATLTGFLAFGAHAFRGSSAAATARNALVLTLLTYPVQFAIDRGNIEPFAFFLVALFLREFHNARHERAAAFLGAAIALKIFPAAFLLLYLRPLRTKPIVQTLGIAGLLTVGSFALLDRPILENAKRLLEILSSYESTSFNEGVLSARYSTSLRSMLDVVAATAPETLAEAAATLQSLPMGLLAGGALLGIATRIPVPPWGILAVAVSIMTLVPRTAADYRLIYWLLPLASFVREADDARPNRAMALIFGLLLIPKSLVLVGEVRIATVLNPALAVAFLAILVTTHSGFRSPASRAKANASLDSGAS